MSICVPQFLHHLIPSKHQRQCRQRIYNTHTHIHIRSKYIQYMYQVYVHGYFSTLPYHSLLSSSNQPRFRCISTNFDAFLFPCITSINQTSAPINVKPALYIIPENQARHPTTERFQIKQPTSSLLYLHLYQARYRADTGQRSPRPCATRTATAHPKLYIVVVVL